MKLVIFAGGSGRRLWPISRQKSPKQFEPILGDRSTLQLGVDRVLAAYGAENIFISTNEKYVDLVREQLPELPPENIIGEPARRDLAAAVGLALMHLGRSAQSADEPVAILWGDNYMDQVATFRQVLAAAETLLREQKAKILFMDWSWGKIRRGGGTAVLPICLTLLSPAPGGLPPNVCGKDACVEYWLLRDNNWLCPAAVPTAAAENLAATVRNWPDNWSG